MTRGLLARRRLLSVCACAVLVMVTSGAGCSTTTPAPTVSGKALTIYLSAPANLSDNPAAQDVLDAEQLAFNQLRHQVRGYALNLQVLKADKISDNARTAIENTKSAVAYVGEVIPGTSADSVGITNAQDLLQVSPTDTALEYTQKTPVVSGAPDKYYQSFSTYGHTFARMVGTSAEEASALVSAMKGLGVSSVYVEHDGSDYGQVIAHSVSTDAGSLAAKSPSSADAMFYGGNDAAAATKALDAVASANPQIKLLVPSALDDEAFITGLSPAAQRNLYVSVPGLRGSDLTSAGQAFLTSFKSAYGHAPSSPAIFGYAAVEAVVTALQRAGSSAGNHGTVLSALIPTEVKSSVLGPYSITKNGDICLGTASTCTGPPFLLEHERGGHLVPAG